MSSQSLATKSPYLLVEKGCRIVVLADDQYRKRALGCVAPLVAHCDWICKSTCFKSFDGTRNGTRIHGHNSADQRLEDTQA